MLSSAIIVFLQKKLQKIKLRKMKILIRDTFFVLSLLGILLFSSCFRRGGGDIPNDPTDKNFGMHYGGSQNDYAKHVVCTDNNEYVFVGNTKSFSNGGSDIYLVKTDAGGNEIWSKNFGGSANDEAERVQKVNDGGYIIVGTTESQGNGAKDIYLLKVNTQGQQEWEIVLGDQYDDLGNSVIQTKDQGFLVVGGLTDVTNAVKDVSVHKLSATGALEWSATYGELLKDEIAYDVVDTENGYLILGKRGVGENSDIFLVKIDYVGNVVWQKDFERPGFDLGFSLVKTFDGNFVIAGQIELGTGDSKNTNVYLIKVDPSGHIVWDNHYGENEKWVYEDAYFVSTTVDNKLIVSGRNKSAALLMIVGDDGEMEWMKSYGDENAAESKIAFCAVQNKTGSFVVVGGEPNSSSGNAFLLMTDYKGDELEVYTGY